MNLKSILKYTIWFLIFPFFVMLVTGYFVIKNPIAFQKSTTIRTANLNELSFQREQMGIDIRSLLEAIPYKESGGMVYEVEPEKKYRKTIKQGYGNCSNLAFGLGFYLNQINHKYQIVHLMPPDSFLKGNGHTVVHTSYELNGGQHVGIVDVLEGGLPKSGTTLIGLAELRQGNLNNTSILSLNNRKDSVSSYYGELLNKSVIGIIASEDVNEYFNFLRLIHVPIGGGKIEKIIYDGVAILFGKYPATYVDIRDYDTLFENNRNIILISGSFLFALRLFVLVSVFIIGLFAYIRIKSS